MKWIVTTCNGREECVEYLRSQIPGLIVNKDDFKDTGIFKSTAWWNYQRSFQLAGEEACVIMDDDIGLCRDFIPKVMAEIQKDPHQIITFFSMKRADRELGTRMMPAKTFIGMCCVYYPPGFATNFENYMNIWYSKLENKSGKSTLFHCPIEFALQDYMAYCKVRYKIVVPNLVQHLGLKSAINPKRNPGRYSTTYKNDPSK